MSSANNITFATYNAGRKNDFNNVVERTSSGQRTYQTNLSPNQQIQQRKAQKYVTDRISNMGDVIALQDGISEDRPEVRNLMKHNYEVFIEGDTGIAVNRKKFAEVKNASTTINKGKSKGQTIAIAITKDFGNPPKITAYVSIQVPGYHLENDLWNDETGMYESEDRAECSQDIANEIKKIIETHHCDKVIVGGDMNTSQLLSPKHFTPWKNLGFHVFSPKGPTNITTNPKFGTQMQERTLDHILVWEKPTWNNLSARIYRKFFGDSRKAITQGPFTTNFDPNKSYSDHIPVYLRETKDSKRTFFKIIYDQIYRVPAAPASESVEETSEDPGNTWISLSVNGSKDMNQLTTLGCWIHLEDQKTQEGMKRILLPVGWRNNNNEIVNENNEVKFRIQEDNTVTFAKQNAEK